MSKNILYIEDNPLNITLIEKFLKSYDCTIMSEYHAVSGIRRAVITRPDLIILDVHLPDYSGVSVIRSLRDRKETKDIPIIAFTAMDSMSMERSCLDAGANTFLRKPISQAAFIDALQEHIELTQETNAQC